GEDEAVRLAVRVGEGDEVDVGRVQHQLHGDEDAQGAALDEQPEDADAQQRRREHQAPGHGDHAWPSVAIGTAGTAGAGGASGAGISGAGAAERFGWTMLVSSSPCTVSGRAVTRAPIMTAVSRMPRISKGMTRGPKRASVMVPRSLGVPGCCVHA